MKPTILQRLKVIGPGLTIGVCFATWCAATFPFSADFVGRLGVWSFIMAGPFLAIPMGGGSPCFLFSIWAFPFIAAHPLKPALLTGWFTGLGLFIWFGANYFSFIHMAYGA